MPNQRACIPCKYHEAQDYLDRRRSEGADLKTINKELNSPYRKKVFGYGTGPSVMMLQTHLLEHRGLAPVSGNLPSFSDTGRAVVPSAPDSGSGDVATAIQKEALQMLERGELRINAAQALKAQEMIDRRLEKAKDRELTMVLARLMTAQQAPPPALIVGDDAIEGVAVEVE